MDMYIYAYKYIYTHTYTYTGQQIAAGGDSPAPAAEQLKPAAQVHLD